MDNVLEHLERPDHALIELARILAPAGILALRVPHWKSPGGMTPQHRSLWHEGSLDDWITARRGTLEGRGQFDLVHRRTLHAHPLAWHQREHLGRELVAWGPRYIDFVLEHKG